jgi:hypothetical protein
MRPSRSRRAGRRRRNRRAAGWASTRGTQATGRYSGPPGSHGPRAGWAGSVIGGFLSRRLPKPSLRLMVCRWSQNPKSVGGGAAPSATLQTVAAIRESEPGNQIRAPGPRHVAGNAADDRPSRVGLGGLCRFRQPLWPLFVVRVGFALAAGFLLLFESQLSAIDDDADVPQIS